MFRFGTVNTDTALVPINIIPSQLHQFRRATNPPKPNQGKNESPLGIRAGIQHLLCFLAGDNQLAELLTYRNDVKKKSFWKHRPSSIDTSMDGSYSMGPIKRNPNDSAAIWLSSSKAAFKPRPIPLHQIEQSSEFSESLAALSTSSVDASWGRNDWRRKMEEVASASVDEMMTTNRSDSSRDPPKIPQRSEVGGKPPGQVDGPEYHASTEANSHRTLSAMDNACRVRRMPLSSTSSKPELWPCAITPANRSMIS